MRSRRDAINVLPVLFLFIWSVGLGNPTGDPGPATRASEGMNKGQIDHPIEFIQSAKLEQRKIYLVKKQAEVAEPLNAIPPGLAVYSIPADDAHKSSAAIKDDNDLSATYALAYNDRGLHLFVDVTDDKIVAGQDYLSLTPVKAEGMYNCDSIQISIDQGLDRTPHWDGNDQEIGLALGATPNTKQSWCWTLGRAPTTDECDFHVTPTPKGYFVDALLSWKFLNSVDRKNRKAFGFNLIVNDNDGQGRKGWIFLSKGIGDAKSMEDNLIAILDDGLPNVIGLFKKVYVSTATTPLFLYAMQGLNGRQFDLVAKDEAGTRKSLLLRPTPLDMPPNAVGQVNATFNIDGFKSGEITVQCLADGSPVKTFTFQKLNVKETIEKIEREISDLQKGTLELRRRKLPVGYLLSKLAVMSTQTLFAKDNLSDYQVNGSAYYLGKATRRISEIESLMKVAKQEYDAIAEGTIADRFKTYRYITSPITMIDGYPNAKTMDDFGQIATKVNLYKIFGWN